MATARLFKSGNSQAVRLPKAFRLRGDEVEIFRRGDEIVMREKKDGMGRAYDLLVGLPEDVFPKKRVDSPPQRHAVAAGLVLVSNNEREFSRVADLKLENWARL